MFDLKQLLESAFTVALAHRTVGSSKGNLHRDRSAAWVEAIADEFRRLSAHDPSVKIFSRGYSKNRGDFGLNELLYDVSVCRTKTVESAVNGKQLQYVCEALWQIESEFARNSRAAVWDFNKLVIGAAQNKLFIGPQVSNTAAFLRPLTSLAAACSGTVYSALVPHPDCWPTVSASIHLWRFERGNWVSI